jgi:hypothetical protein
MHMTIVDTIHISVIVYVDGVYLIGHAAKRMVQHGRRIYLVRTCHQ